MYICINSINTYRISVIIIKLIIDKTFTPDKTFDFEYLYNYII